MSDVQISRTPVPPRVAMTYCTARLRSPDGGPWSVSWLFLGLTAMMAAGVPETATISGNGPELMATWEERGGGQ